VATPVLREDDRAPYTPPPPRVIGNRNTGTMARVGNTQRRRASTWVLVALSLLGLLAVVALGAGIYLANHTQQAVVPNLKGLTADDARTKLTAVKLRGTQKTTTEDSCTKNTVVSQSPEAGLKVAENSEITFTVCVGPGQVPIPAGLVGMDKASAEKALKDLGLTVAYGTAQDSDKPKDQVLAVDPKEGTSVEKGSTVTLTLSLGNLVPVPNVTTLTATDATNKLKGAKFKVAMQTRLTTDPAEVGIVLLQSPEAGVIRKVGDTITIYVGALATTNSPSPTGSPSAGG